MEEDDYYYCDDDDYDEDGGYGEDTDGARAADTGATRGEEHARAEEAQRMKAAHAVAQVAFSGDTVKAVSMGSVMTRLRALIERVSALLYVSKAFAAQLLRRHGFREDVANEAFLMDPAADYTALGITCAEARVESTLVYAHPALPTHAAPSSPDANRARACGHGTETKAETQVAAAGAQEEPLMCGICAFEDGEQEGNALLRLSGCGHCFCRDCWADNVRGKLAFQDSLLTLRCLADGCGQLLYVLDLTQKLLEARVVEAGDEAGVQAPEGSAAGGAGQLDPVLARSPTSLVALIERALVAEFISRDTRLYFCANPSGCDCIIYWPSAGGKSLLLLCPDCSFPFCARCKCVTHAPATCAEYANWMQRFSDGGASTVVILKETKPCPRCHERILKISGCNHMTCRCGYEFCWICLGGWSGHNGDSFNCRASIIAAPEAGLSHETSELYRNFQGYSAHRNSLDASEGSLAQLRQRVARFCADKETTPQAAARERELLGAAVRVRAVLQLARNTLACTYVSDFARSLGCPAGQAYTVDPLERHRRGQLVEATEDLTAALERLVMGAGALPTAEELMERAGTVQRRTESLLL